MASFKIKTETGEWLEISSLQGKTGAKCIYLVSSPTILDGNVGDICFASIGTRLYFYSPKTETGWGAPSLISDSNHTLNFSKSLIPLLNENNYFSIMKSFFISMGGEHLFDLSAICDEWYKATRQGWIGGSNVATGEKTGDNQGVLCAPTIGEGKPLDGYIYNPLFACVDCNWFLDGEGEPHITAIDGICGDFERDNPLKLVGVIQMAGWSKKEVIDGEVHYWYSGLNIEHQGFSPLPESVREDGSVREWVVHSKYVAGEDRGSYSGVYPYPHTSIENEFHIRGLNYGGKTSADDAFVKLMLAIKYATIDPSLYFTGCVDYDFCYPVAVPETLTDRVILKDSHADKFILGSDAWVGHEVDRNSYSTASYRGTIISKEPIGNGLVAVYLSLENGERISSTAPIIKNGEESFCYVSTSPWKTGSCDLIEGNDGYIYTGDRSSGPFMLQRIEMGLGGYEVISDCIIDYNRREDDTYFAEALVCGNPRDYSETPTGNYRRSSFALECPANAGDFIISEYGYDGSVWLPSKIQNPFVNESRNLLYVLGGEEGRKKWISGGALDSEGYIITDIAREMDEVGWNILTRISSTGRRKQA